MLCVLTSRDVNGDVDTVVQESLHYHGEINAGCGSLFSRHVTLMVTLTSDVDTVVQESLHCHVKISAGCCWVFSHHVTLMVALTLLCRSLCTTMGRSARAVVACRHVTSHNVNGDVDPVLQESLHYHGEISTGCCCVPSCHVT